MKTYIIHNNILPNYQFVSNGSFGIVYQNRTYPNEVTKIIPYDCFTDSVKQAINNEISIINKINRSNIYDKSHFFVAK